MQKWLFTGSLILACLMAQTTTAQTLDKIKSASRDYSSSDQGSSSSSSNSNNSSETYYPSGETYVETYSDYYDEVDTDKADGSYEPRREKVFVEKPWRAMGDFTFRQSVDNRKVLITNFQFNRAQNYWFYSLRYNQFREHRAKETDTYSTLEIQFLGFHTMSKPVSFAAATGLMHETFSNRWYWEHLALLNIEVSPTISFYAEGRIAMDNGFMIRSEGTLSSFITLKKWERSSFKMGVFFTSALYYEEVPVENIGLNANIGF